MSRISVITVTLGDKNFVILLDLDSFRKSESRKNGTKEDLLYDDYDNFEFDEDNANSKSKTQSPNNTRKKIECKKCSYKTNNEAPMKRHIESHHSKQRQIPNQKEFKYCNRKFISQTDLTNHEKEEHIQDASVQCSLCDFTARNKDILTKHMQVAMGHKKSQSNFHLRPL